ncbi:hypothetical protein_gp246 [Bacillus phage vB_BceM_WH1]|nr:hypothetical protein_gp246 [Bacillus phage vB_BceM_WH1]
MRDYKGKEVIIGDKRASLNFYKSIIGKKGTVTDRATLTGWFVNISRSETVAVYDEWIVHEDDLLVIPKENEETISSMKQEENPYE